MQHQEMIQPTHLGVIGRTCILSLGGRDSNRLI